MIKQQFEYSEVQHCFKDRPVVKKFITVIDEFTHHFTGETMRYCRIESVGFMGHSFAEYKMLDGDQFQRIVDAKIGGDCNA